MRFMPEGEVKAVELAKESGQYIVVCTQGQGGAPDADFPTIDEALQYVEEEYGQGCFAIVYPDGSWHKWDEQD